MKTLENLEADLIGRRFVDCELLTAYYAAFKREVSPRAAKDFARTVLAMQNLSMVAFIGELEAFIKNRKRFTHQRVTVTTTEDEGTATEALKAEFFLDAEHLEGIMHEELKHLPLQTA